MNNIQSEHHQTISLTDSAAQKVFELIAVQGDFSFCLRVLVKGGGCSGFQYDFKLDKNKNDGDFVMECSVRSGHEGKQDTQHRMTKTGVRQSDSIYVRVDPQSLALLKGASIDYQRDEKGERFVVNNPNANKTCGCGASFCA